MGDVQEIRPSEEKWVNAKVVAAHVSVSPGHILKMARNGQIPYRNCGFGGREYRRFRISEVDRAIQNETTNAPTRQRNSKKAG